MISLVDLPVELLYEIQLFALSPSLPCASSYLHEVFSNAASHYKAQYLIGRSHKEKDHPYVSETYSVALRYPLCDQKVFEVVFERLKVLEFPLGNPIQLPKRLFRSLCASDGNMWTENSSPLPFLRYLYSRRPGLPSIDVNSHNGYALTKAVHARFVPLVHFLLDHQASPSCREALAVKVAIRQKDLAMVKLLIERSDTLQRGRKRRKLPDRLTPDRDMLRLSVSVDARDIVEYLYREKRVIPDMRTLHRMASF